MLTRYDFELALEQVAEKFYIHGASQFGRVRGGNSEENENYFRNVATDLRSNLNCQQIMLAKGSCPDSGVFGDFGYKNEEEINWQAVAQQKIVVLEVEGVRRHKRFIEVDISEIPNFDLPLKTDSGVEINLNNVNGYGEFFGVEYKASQSNSETSISVASFNSTCPSRTKTVKLKNTLMYHGFKTTSRKKPVDGYDEIKVCKINIKIQFSIYYLIVNDNPEGRISEIKQIFVCDGGFFAPDMSEEDAAKLSKQLYPKDLGISLNLYRVGLRFRPFFESKRIRANGYGLYTSWEPKIPATIEEEKQRKLLLEEIEMIQQDFADNSELIDESNKDSIKVDGGDSNPDNVIYLTMNEIRIKNRAA